jgi:hypothetical protein
MLNHSTVVTSGIAEASSSTHGCQVLMQAAASVQHPHGLTRFLLHFTRLGRSSVKTAPICQVVFCGNAALRIRLQTALQLSFMDTNPVAGQEAS